MNIAIIGNDLYSQVSAALFASVGNKVVLFGLKDETEFDENEPGLLKMVQEQVNSNRLIFSNDRLTQETLFDFVILSGIQYDQIATQILLKIESSFQAGVKVIILTPSEIGEAEKLSKTLSTKNSTTSVNSIPLLVREGTGIKDFSRPDYIIIGCDDFSARDVISDLFYPFNRVKDVIKYVATKEAEFASFASNAMLATRLSFMNEMASLAENIDIDIDVVRECIGSDPRIGNDYLYPGCGYGGAALVGNVAKVAKELRLLNDDFGLLETISRINERQKDLLFRKIWRYFNSDLEHKTIAIWGVSFKPGSSSIESAPAVMLIKSLLAQNAKVQVYDPIALDNLREHFGEESNIQYIHSSSKALIGADVLAICTEWKEFWSADLELFSTHLREKAIFDGRNIYNPKSFIKNGLKYFGIGRGDSV